MLDMSASFERWITAGSSVRKSSRDVIETVSAATEVIAACMPIIGMALIFPMWADHAELSLMVPEKVEAFSQSGLAIMSSWWAAQASWLKHIGQLSEKSTIGVAPAPLGKTEVGQTVLALAVESIEAVAQIGAAALAPIHRGATDNARRLTRC